MNGLRRIVQQISETYSRLAVVLLAIYTAICVCTITQAVEQGKSFAGTAVSVAIGCIEIASFVGAFLGNKLAERGMYVILGLSLCAGLLSLFLLPAGFSRLHLAGVLEQVAISYVPLALEIALYVIWLKRARAEYRAGI